MTEHDILPPHEACSREHMKERIEKVPELFLVAVDKQTGKESTYGTFLEKSFHGNYDISTW